MSKQCFLNLANVKSKTLKLKSQTFSTLHLFCINEFLMNFQRKSEAVSSASTKVEEVTSEASGTKQQPLSSGLTPFVHQIFSGLVVVALLSVVLASSLSCTLVCINNSLKIAKLFTFVFNLFINISVWDQFETDMLSLTSSMLM